MDYVRAADVLPQELIEELQQYVDGVILYIPKKEEKKACGERKAMKTELAGRNARIYAEFSKGKSIHVLANEYFLAEKSIQRIIRQEKMMRKNHE